MLTVGAVVSMTIASFAPSEPAAAGAGSARMTEPVPVIVPPLSVKAPVELSSRSAEVWPAATR